MTEDVYWPPSFQSTVHAFRTIARARHFEAEKGPNLPDGKPVPIVAMTTTATSSGKGAPAGPATGGWGGPGDRAHPLVEECLPREGPDQALSSQRNGSSSVAPL